MQYSSQVALQVPPTRASLTCSVIKLVVEGVHSTVSKRLHQQLPLTTNSNVSIGQLGPVPVRYKNIFILAAVAVIEGLLIVPISSLFSHNGVVCCPGHYIKNRYDHYSKLYELNDTFIIKTDLTKHLLI